jgi:gliding motility-associated-like protein
MKRGVILLVLFVLAIFRAFGQCVCSTIHPINAGLVACYPFNGNANDQTVNGNHGVVSNVVPTADRFGNPNSAYFFNGNNSIIRVPANPSLQPTNKLSISVWIRTEPKSLFPPTWSFIVTYRNDNFSAPYNSYNLSTHPYAPYSHKWSFMLASTSNNLDNELVGKMVKQDYVWEHIVATYDGSVMKIYTNGNLDTTRNINIPAIRYSNYGLNIGNHDAGPSTCVHGAMDDLRIYNRAITACEVRYLYNNCSGTPAGDLINEETVGTCAGKPVILNAGYNGMSYSWTPSLFLNNDTSKTPIATVYQSTYFFVTASDGLCYYKDSVLVTVTQPTIQINRNESICPGDSVQLQVSGAQSYNWKSNSTLSDTTIANPYAKPMITTVYFVTANVNGCMVRDSVHVSLTNNIIAQAGNDTLICKGDVIKFLATGGSRFAWSPNLEISDTTIRDPNVYPTQSRWYRLNTFSGLCEATDSLFITVNEKPTLVVGDTILCGLNNVFVPDVRSTLADSYLWQPATYLSSDAVQYPKVSPKGSIKYIITAKNTSTGCSVTDTMKIKLGNPKANFSVSAPLLIVPGIVSMNNTSNPLSANFMWYIDDIFYANNTHSQVDITEAKKYNIKLVVADSLGCTDSVVKIIEGKRNQTIFIPNVFSPNGDQINDFFAVSFDVDIYQKLEGTVWNRWGEKVAEFDGKKGNWWDGKFDGKVCPDGVYFYLINTVNLEGVVENHHGTITLLR